MLLRCGVNSQATGFGSPISRDQVDANMGLWGLRVCNTFWRDCAGLD